ncbi:MAG: hypothetical protein ACREJ0_27800 [Geminicoccaceae bacterium]|jgi:hypothetical protein
MNGWPGHGIRTLVLALVLALGMSFSVVQGGLMAAEMAVSADGADHGAGGCDRCGGGDHPSMDAGTCLAVCGTTAQGLMPGELLTLPSASRPSLHVARLHLSSQFHSPDHGPPKILILG